MPKDKATHLGNCIRDARIACRLTQQQLADDCHVAVKTVQNIEKGTMNPSYEILYPIVNRLGISANILFNPDISDADKDLECLAGKLQVCTPQERSFIIHTVDCMVSQFLTNREETESE